MTAALSLAAMPSSDDRDCPQEAAGSGAPAEGGRRLVYHIGGLCLGIAIPLLGIIGGAQWSYANRERTELEANAIARARDVATAVDRELVGLTSALDVLGTAASLQRGDLPTFGEMVAGVSKRTGVVPILRGTDGRHIINPYFPTGEATPEPRIFDVDQAALRSGEVQVTGFFNEAPTGAPVFALEVAVRRKDEPAYLLGIAVPVERIRAGIAPQAAGENWTVTVADGRGRLIFGTGETTVPGQMTAPLPADLAKSPQGMLLREVNGAQRVVAFARSQRSAWTVSVETDRAAYEAPLRRSLTFFALAAGAAILLSLVFAVIASRRLASWLGGLVTRAQAIGRGEVVEKVPTEVAEVDEVARALDAAAEEVRKRLAAEEAAAEAGRRILSVFESIGEAVVVVDRDGRVGYLNQLARTTFAGGRDVVGERALDAFTAEAVSSLRWVLARARSRGTMQRGEIAHPSEGTWYETTVVPSPQGFTVFLRDVTERRRSAEERETMVRELHHRVKNTLATVQAIASTSARTAVDLEAFRDAFADRIVSLSRTHTLLRERSWEHVDLRQLVVGELVAYEEEGRVTIDGEEIYLPSGLGMTLGMALHELTTNAVKHGALSNAAGCIAVSWHIGERNGVARLHFSWTESKGPPVAEPTRKGFGSQLMGKMLTRQFDATVEQTWDPAGFRVVFDAAVGA